MKVTETDPRVQSLMKQLAKLTTEFGKATGESTALTFETFARQYQAEKLANPTIRASTKRAFEQQVRNHLIPGFGYLELDKVVNRDWLAWVEAVRALNKYKHPRERQVTRFFQARKCLTEILHAAKNEGHIDRVPKFDNPDVPKKIGRAVPDAEVLKILRNSPRPWRFTFYCFWKTGCRPREILKWEWPMIRFNEPGKTWVDIPARISKTARDRSIPLNPGVSRILAIRKRLGNGSKFVFPSRDPAIPQLAYHTAWANAGKRAGVKAFPYDMRRTFITRRIQAKDPAVLIAQILDTSVKMLQDVYVKPDADVLEALVR